MVRTFIPAVLLAATAVAAPLTASASTAPRSFGDCMDLAVAEHGVDPWLAHDACDAVSFEDCYWTFRHEYVPATLAAAACRLRDK
ncbi:hypothetical protein [Amycolatopsis anabasis]|uniref:hypothetical protein n=1 Tax=Amycolatopsis anabasis TaxID=1840409 RepID=UPI00131DA199|nr:hypothetical protein [Amycolatopsis anabasis]